MLTPLCVAVIELIGFDAVSECAYVGPQVAKDMVVPVFVHVLELYRLATVRAEK